MTKLKAVKTVKFKGQYLSPGTVFEVEDKETVQYLLNELAAVKTTLDKSQTSMDMLMEVKGVNKKVAEILLAKGVDSVDKLSGESIADLMKMGISEKQATTIYKSFGD